MSKGTVKVRYTVGLGNNIFQYMYSRLLSEIHDAYLSTNALNCLGVKSSVYMENPNLPKVNISKLETDFHQYLNNTLPPSNYYVFTYPEDYTIYKPYIESIRGWVPDVPTTNDKDLVLHLRLGDRLLLSDDQDPCMRTSPQEYIKAIKAFRYEDLHIVTDMKCWRYLTQEELSAMRFHTGVPAHKMGDIKVATDYYNSLVEEFNVLNPILRVNHPVNDDFIFMRSFKQILFKHGTLAWWAATLSHATKVGVYGPWRPIKGDRNKNLGQTDFEGWFQWGI